MREVQQAACRKHRGHQGSRDYDFLLHGRSRSQIKKVFHGIALVAEGETVGIVGIDGAGLPKLPVMGDTLVVGAAVVGLTPRLPIS
jgi:hypothetical protein